MAKLQFSILSTSYVVISNRRMVELYFNLSVNYFHMQLM